MRIIHGHDYYDNALAFGRDDAVLFVRQKEHFLREKDVPFVWPWKELRLWFREADKRYSIPSTITGEFETKKFRFSLTSIAVLFCGKVHLGLRLDTNDPRTYERQQAFFWTIETFQAWLDEHSLVPIKGRWLRHRVANKDDLVDPAILLQTYEAPKALLDWMIENKVVLGFRTLNWNLYRRRNDNDKPWDINGDRLKDIQFYKRLDAFSAFQEIAMWVGGVLPGNANAMVTVDDSVRIAKHGFDKASFRNMERK
jgi:hypothetical protein